MREINNAGYIYIDASKELRTKYSVQTKSKQRDTVREFFDYFEQNHKMVDGYEGTPEYAEAISGMREDIEDELLGEPGISKKEWDACLDEPDFVNIEGQFNDMKFWRFDEDISLGKDK